jgi:hypothetical protein
MAGVRVTADCAVYFRLSVESLTAGQEIPAGEFADHLLSTGAPVESLDDHVAGESVGDPRTPPELTAGDPTAGGGPEAADLGGDVALAMQVPAGSVADVLAWVDGDLERAAAALTAEQANGGKPRSTLVSQLTALLDT